MKGEQLRRHGAQWLNLLGQGNLVGSDTYWHGYDSFCGCIIVRASIHWYAMLLLCSVDCYLHVSDQIALSFLQCVICLTYRLPLLSPRLPLLSPHPYVTRFVRRVSKNAGKLSCHQFDALLTRY